MTNNSSNDQMRSHQEAYETAQYNANHSNLARCFLEQREWMQAWHRLCESIATTLNVNSAGGLEELSIAVSDAIQQLQSRASAHETRAELVMADGTPLYDYLKDAIPDQEVMDDWTRGYEEMKRRLFRILGPQLRPSAQKAGGES